MDDLMWNEKTWNEIKLWHEKKNQRNGMKWKWTYENENDTEHENDMNMEMDMEMGWNEMK